jgi:hypothetical protein
MKMKLDTNKTKVVILTSHYRIAGYISVLHEARVTDYICESKNFIAVTDAEIWNHDHRRVVSTSFLNINREDVELIIPEDCVTQDFGMHIF